MVLKTRPGHAVRAKSWFCRGCLLVFVVTELVFSEYHLWLRLVASTLFLCLESFWAYLVPRAFLQYVSVSMFYHS